MINQDTRKRAQRTRGIVWTSCLISFLVLILVTNLLTAQSVLSQEQGCAINLGPCSRQLGDCTVILDILPKPVKAMEELIFQVTLSEDCRHGVPVIDLSMPGMTMGQNRVTLEKNNRGVYEGTGIIVRCPSGKKTWQVTVTVPQCGAVDFVFDVIY